MGLGITITGSDTLGSVTAMFNFLATPAGQDVVQDFRALNKDVIGWIGDLIGVIHKRHEADISTRVPPAPAA